jgi:hypothetical protein
MSKKAQVFLSYAHEDRKFVLGFYDRLSKAGFQPWMDVNSLVPGERWVEKIREGLLNSDCVLIFLTKNAISKEGYLNKEIKSALEIAKEKPEGTIFIIPVKVEDVEVPRSLQHIQWVELYSEDGWNKILIALESRSKAIAEESFERLEEAVKGVKKPKKHIFVAMPFTPELEDYFYYGIRVPIKQTDFNYLRIDKETFTGEILQQIKTGIQSAEAMIAVLDGANPNVYLEVGFAWGNKIPTILLIRDVKELRFDISGHRCLVYSSIRNLEEILTTELSNLKQKGIISP